LSRREAIPIRCRFEKGEKMTEIQGWIVITLVVIVVFSQWYLARGR
jgi:hypothetical protein